MTINLVCPTFFGQNVPVQWVSLPFYFVVYVFVAIYLLFFWLGGEVDVVYYLFMQAKTLNDFSNVCISGLLTVCLLMYVYAV